MLKFHTIARYQLVTIFKKCKPQSEMGVVDPGVLPGVPATPTASTPALPPSTPLTPATPAPTPVASLDRPGDKEKEDKQTFQVSDCRSLVKTLVCGVKTITWGITSCKAPGGEYLHARPVTPFLCEARGAALCELCMPALQKLSSSPTSSFNRRRPRSTSSW